MKKYMLIGIGTLLAAIIAVVILVVLNLGDIIKVAVEKYGPPITKTEVKLGSADISILSGSGALSDFLLGNPQGFSMPSAIECDTIRVSIVKDSLTTDRIIIEEIFVDGPIISYEKKGNTDNFKTIVNNIKKTVASEEKQDQHAETTPSETGSEKTIQINNFIVKNGHINLGGSMLNAFGEQSMGIDLPDIHLKDIGKDKETTPAEAFALVLSEMTGDITGTISQVGKQLQKELGKAVDGVTNGAGSAGGVLKGLFGSDE
ncbi:hypothetical protein GO013_00470 [Pseudodesulfovibrio sp. JC047]|uniref:hypothetical protein n=1 Tax=Pseudodesulfovibrio sp. JC047 TaxID=2683199 RepID=UPI0013D4D8BA|nr:hypothetical protein [Pseudodesulfovibrio sp. JC047]NDV17891.1 hypothetical protein [Pseudodesulfovibrio sp. JC047]